MEYKDIISISNMGGLFSLVTTKADGAVVNSLEDGSKKFVSGRKHEFTPLESIEVYTTGENVPLTEIFIAMQDKDGDVQAFDIKGANKESLFEFISSIYPGIDRDRVYPSDIKKMIKWYRILSANNLLEDLNQDLEKDEKEEKKEKKSKTATEKKATKKSTKKATKKATKKKSS